MSIFHDQAALMQKARQQLHEKAVNPYAVGTAAAMKATGDKPPLKKSTITKAHEIAKKVEKAGYEPEGDQIDEGKVELKQRNKNEMQRKAGNLGREVVSTPKTKKHAAKRGAAMDRMNKLVSVIARDDEKKRFDRIGQSPLHNSYEPESELVEYAQGGGGSSPNLPPAVYKFVDELPQNIQKFGKKIKKVVTGEEVISYLIDNGFAETGQNALKIMENMSESWMEEIVEARAEEKRGYGSTGEQRQRQKSGEEGPRGRRPVTSYSGGQNPHNRGRSLTKTQRRASSRRYVDQPGGVYAAPENKQGKNRYAEMQAKKRDQSHMSSRFD